MAERIEEADAVIQQCLALCRERRAHLETEARSLALLSDIQLQMGNTDAAIRAARTGIACAEQQTADYFKAMTLLSLARALLSQEEKGQLQSAGEALQAAAELVDKTGGRTLYPQILEAQARLAQLQGDESLSAEQLAAARQAYADIGAHGHVLRLQNSAS